MRVKRMVGNRRVGRGGGGARERSRGEGRKWESIGG